MMTRSRLRDYDTAGLGMKADAVEQQAAALDATAASVQQQAAELESAWPDGNGQQAAARMRESAEQFAAEATRIRETIPVFRNCAVALAAAQQLLAVADTKEQANQYLVADDNGQVGFTPEFESLPDDRRPPQYRLRTELQHEYFVVLDQATKLDEQVATALYGLLGWNPPFPQRPDTGPVDLSDEAIADQLMNSQQGRFGDCYFLSSLAAIAHANPQFIRDHIRWDPETGTYHVTIHDNNGLFLTKRDVVVDPTDLGDDIGSRTRRSDGGGANFLSIYEAACQKTLNGRLFMGVGGTPSNGMTMITGTSPDFTVVRPQSFEQIRSAIEAQPPAAVAVGTNTGTWPFPAEKDQPYEDRVSSRHAYWVRGFDEQGRIILINPWGPDSGESSSTGFPGEVHLTEEEFRKVVTQTSMVRP